MTETTTLISVRGEARRTVAPDEAGIRVQIEAQRADRDEAMNAAGRAQDEIERRLGALGGVVRRIDTLRAPLGWSTSSLYLHEDYDWDSDKRRHARGWRAGASVSIVARDFELLDPLIDALGAVPDTNVEQVDWAVDRDNPTWPAVRADAIRDSIEKARHYADALGGSLVRIEHIADTGLLGGGEHYTAHAASQSVALSGQRRDAGGRRGPTLDPVPQEIMAVIETRVSARVDAL